MPSYHYIALSQEQKELTGIIEAPDEPLARKKLNDLGLSVISLNEKKTENIPTEKLSETKNIFEFEALDKNQKKIIGTIVAADPIKAYARLFDEYQFNITSLAIPSTKDNKRPNDTLDLLEIQKTYEQQYGKISKLGKKEEADQTYTTEREKLLKKIDTTMKRIEEFLKTFGQDLKQEERDTIQAYLNQLIRIKDSTNLEHIRSTCERMLEHIQTQELFLHQEEKMREIAQVKVETKELLSDLRKTGLKEEIDIMAIMQRWQEYWFFKFLLSFFLRFKKLLPPEMLQLKGDIRTINKHLWSYVKLLITERSKVIKIEAWQSIKSLLEEKKRLKLKFHALKLEQNAASQAAANANSRWEQRGTALGWILSFYLLSYMLTYTLTVKQFSFLPLAKKFYFYQTGFTKGLTLFLFFSYSTVMLSGFWLKNYRRSLYIVYPITLFLYLLLMINLM